MMHVDTFGGDATTCQATDRPTAPRHRFSLTAAELLRLGLSQVGYVTAAMNGGRLVNIVIRGADGTAVATAEDLEHVVEIAEQLGLVLVPVH
jgi:hypothetical protein